ncbi:hypothetical protein CVIRNUC_004184 [Coccomyxa viridis]|uniref:Uncharacterized protein n=1 Tax=Coccomyxa viridis TaxID=1274662 RepID=A0AAV1I510_9CHLO|nr:hypothetical protein CVIRNUC_004184 [Coccomyxa viridis]
MIIHCAKVDDYEGYLALKMAQVVGTEREWTEDPAKAQRVRATLEACIRETGWDVSIAKLFHIMFPGVYKWCGENRSTIPFFLFNGTYWQQHKYTAGVMTTLSDVLEVVPGGQGEGGQ